MKNAHVDVGKTHFPKADKIIHEHCTLLKDHLDHHLNYLIMHTRQPILIGGWIKGE